jgi:Arc/MetJ-type ribon-helix-helix transcriptional regulator
VKNPAMTLAKKRTSLDLPPDLLERTDEAVRLGAARSRNSLIAVALEDYLDALDRVASIDARFAEMSDDASYLDMQRKLAIDFAESEAPIFTGSLGEADDVDAVEKEPALETAGP